MVNRSLFALLTALELVCSGSFSPLSAGRRLRTGTAPVTPAALSFDSPSPNRQVSGTLHLALAGDFSSVQSVEYLLGNYRLAKQTAAPFAFDWNSALASDGSSQITAIARDSLNGIVFQASQPVLLQNYGNTAEVVDSALNQTLSGTISLTLHATDSKHFPAYWQIFVDGELAALRFTDQTGRNEASLTQTLDTTRYPNGNHEFHFAFHSNDYNAPNPPGGNLDFRGGVTQPVTFDNGRAFMEPAANFLHVYAAPGTSFPLTCRRLYTDGDQGACQSPQWTSADTGIAQVDASGLLSAVQEGFTTVTLAEGGRETKIRVWVKNDPGIPHFTGNGGMSASYIDGKSTFVIAPFLLSPESLRKSPALLAEVRRAGVNTLSRGFYQNVPDISVPFDQWKQGYDATVLPDWEWARANGFHVLPAGDDVARNIGTEGWRTLNWPFGKQAVQYAVQKLAESGTALGIEMLDESSGFWGANPIPPGKLGSPHAIQSIACVAGTCTALWPEIASTRFHDSVNNGLTFILTGDSPLSTPPNQWYTVRNVTQNGFDFTSSLPLNGTFADSVEFQWFARQNTCSGSPCSPPVLNNALATIQNWVRSVNFSLPVSWPPAGIALTAAQANWMGQGGLSDYASHYWDSNQQRKTYIFGEGIRETTNSMLTAFYDRQPFMQQNRPQLMLQSMTGTNYTKNSPAGTDSFNPPVDELQHAGIVPKAVVSGMMSAAAAGASGLRLYQFETPDDHAANTAQRPGGGGIQTGASPFLGEVNNWTAMSFGARMLTGPLQPYLLGQAQNSPAYGRNFVTAVRTSAAGRLLMIVNAWDGARQLSIGFAPYQYGFGAVRYRLSDTGISTAYLTGSDSDTLTLEAGETAAYVFPNSAALPVDLVTFTPEALGVKTVLRYSYLRPASVPAFGEAVECSNGCTVAIDRSLGEFYYQYSYDGGCGSPVTLAGIQKHLRLRRPKVCQ